MGSDIPTTSSMSTWALSKAIEQKQWATAIQLLKVFPDLAKMRSKRQDLFSNGTGSTRILPLHEALIHNAPFTVIKTLVMEYPKALRKKEKTYKRLPLHCACLHANADSSVISLLVNKYSEACSIRDSHEHVPLHYAVLNGADPKVLKILLDASPAEGSYDLLGWTPVDISLDTKSKVEIARENLLGLSSAAKLPAAKSLQKSY